MLCLDRNKFKEIPMAVTKLRSLKCLHMNDNRLVKLHQKYAPIKKPNTRFNIIHSLRDLVDLRYLWLRRNRLKELSTQLCTVRRLAVVHLESNFIEHISDAIGIMQHLKQLYASGHTLLLFSMQRLAFSSQCDLDTS